MENIQVFLNFCENYGVPKTGLFQTVDLFEGRNLAQVLNCIQQLGTEASLICYTTLEKLLVSCMIRGRDQETRGSLCGN